MKGFPKAIASCLLVAAMAPAQVEAPPAVRLGVENGAHLLQVRTYVTGTVLLALGEIAVPPIRIGEIDLNVTPRFVVSLGTMNPGQLLSLPVTRQLRDLHVEAVLVDADFRLHDSNTVALMDAFLDLVDATFRATLVSTDSIPPEFSVGAALTAPTNGYVFTVDGFETANTVTNVYLRLVEPNDKEIVLPVLTDYQASAHLGTEIGEEVNVYLLRQVRGATGPEVYRLMVRLPVPIIK